MVTDQAGLGDQGFNDLAKAGVDQSAQELGGRSQIIQSSDQSQYVTNLTQSVQGGATVTTAVGSLLTDAVAEVAQSYPDAKFTLVDAVATDQSGAPLRNVAGVTFREQEGAFLAGVVAGMTTKTGTVGFIGGMEVPAVVRFNSGFIAGVKSANPAVEVKTAYVGSFADAAKGRELAAGMYDSNADVVMTAAGGSSMGVFDAVKDAGSEHWVIGVDTCKIDLAPQNTLTAVVKDVQGAVFRENKAAADGQFTGGETSLGLSDGALELCAENYADLPANVQQRVKDATTAILDKRVVPPATANELATFTPTPY